MILLHKQQSREPGLYGRLVRESAGSALVVVLGVVLVIGLIVAGLAGQVRIHLRATRLNAEVADAQSTVSSAFQQAATVVQDVLGQPDAQVQLAAGTPDCDPVTDSWSQTLQYCVRRFPALPGDPGAPILVGSLPETLTQVPVEVKFRLPHSLSAKTARGWLLLDMAASPPKVVYVIQDHRWCRPGSTSVPCDRG